MTSMLCLVIALAVVNFRLAKSACPSYNEYKNTNIPGGEYVDRRTVEDCRAACDAKLGCVSFDFNSENQWCWLLSTQSGKQPSSDIDHYDCSDPVPQETDLVQSTANIQCFTTNYEGSVTDFSSTSTEVVWETPLPGFSFQWPSAASLFPLSTIKFSSSTNMAYFKVIFTKTNGEKVTVGPIYPTQKTTDVSYVGRVKDKVLVYFAPVDFRQNVSISELQINACSNVPILGSLFCIVKAIFSFVLNIVTFGHFTIQSGKISWSGAAELPFIELNTNCLGKGVSEFARMTFDNHTNFNLISVKIWNGDVSVPVIRSDSVQTDTFDYDQEGVVFARNVKGDRIRATIVPNTVENQGIISVIRFIKYSVFIYSN